MSSAPEPQSRYNRFSDDLRRRYGAKVYKLTLDAGLSCPNRDGTVGAGGCVFCDPEGGTGRGEDRSDIPLARQIAEGKAGLRRRYRAERFIAYFQSFSNTYGPVDRLGRLYGEAAADPEVVALSIATRPDCLPDPVLDLLAGYASRIETWVELGIQSLHEPSLRWMGRGHGTDVIEEAVSALRRRGVHVCAHLILGLPGETQTEMTATARGVSGMGVEAVKLHMLYVTRGARLAADHGAGRLDLLSRDEYIGAVVAVLENLAPGIVIQRLVSEARPDRLSAPDWLRDKSAVIRGIERRLERLDTRQGRLWTPE